MVGHVDKAKVRREGSNTEVLETLSPRQREVMRLRAKGLHMHEIGHAMRLSPHTIADYLKTLHKAFGVSNSIELAVIAAKAGLV